MKFVGLIFTTAGLSALPVPATLLFHVDYATAAAALVVGLVAGLALQLGVGLMIKG